MLGVILVAMFVFFVAVGVPISFALGIVSFTGIAALPDIPNTVVFTKMFNGLNSFTLLAVPLFILAANLMNEAGITEKLIECICDLVGHWKGGLAYANVLVSMVFAGISGSSQADTSGVGKIFIPSMEKQGYDKGTAVGVTAASSTLGSIIPPSITMVVYAGIANVSTGALFMTGIVPGILLGLAQMLVIKAYSRKKGFPQSERVPIRTAIRHTVLVQGFFTGLPGGKMIFLLVVVLFFMFVGTFMDAVPAMILFVPIILPSAVALGISPIILGLIIIVTLALGLVTPPYGLCLLLASSISGISIEDGFHGALPYFLSSLAVLLLMLLLPDFWLMIPAAVFPGMF